MNRKRRNGNRKTKNPMSFANSGSAWPNGSAVREEQPLPPLRSCAAAGEQAEQQREADHAPPEVRTQRGPVALEDLVLHREEPVGACELLDDPEIHQHEGGEDRPERQAEIRLGPDLLGEHALEAGLPEPQQVGVEGGGAAEEDQKAHDHRAGDDQRAPADAWTRNVRRDLHVRGRLAVRARPGPGWAGVSSSGRSARPRPSTPRTKAAPGSPVAPCSQVPSRISSRLHSSGGGGSSGGGSVGDAVGDGDGSGPGVDPPPPPPLPPPSTTSSTTARARRRGRSGATTDGVEHSLKSEAKVDAFLLRDETPAGALVAKPEQFIEEGGEGRRSSRPGREQPREHDPDEHLRRFRCGKLGTKETEARQNDESGEEARGQWLCAELRVESRAELRQLPIEVEDVAEQTSVPPFGREERQRTRARARAARLRR